MEVHYFNSVFNFVNWLFLRVSNIISTSLTEGLQSGSIRIRTEKNTFKLKNSDKTILQLLSVLRRYVWNTTLLSIELNKFVSISANKLKFETKI